MSDLVAAMHALDELVSIQSGLAKVAMRTDEGRRRDLINFRRKLANQMTCVMDVAEPLFASDPEGQAEFRRCYSAMRAAAAKHQTYWPAIRLGEDDDQYRLSASAVRAANAAFVASLRTLLATRKERG